MYASTKAFLTMFATSLAPEIRSLGVNAASARTPGAIMLARHDVLPAASHHPGSPSQPPRLYVLTCSAGAFPWLQVDVVVVHPSPMATNFFDAASGLGALMAFKKLAAGPSVIGMSPPWGWMDGGRGGGTQTFRQALRPLTEAC